MATLIQRFHGDVASKSVGGFEIENNHKIIVLFRPYHTIYQQQGKNCLVTGLGFIHLVYCHDIF